MTSASGNEPDEATFRTYAYQRMDLVMTAPKNQPPKNAYETADVRFGKGPSVGTAGEARKRAQQPPNLDRDNWQAFSLADARKLAAEAPPPETPPKP